MPYNISLTFFKNRRNFAAFIYLPIAAVVLFFLLNYLHFNNYPAQVMIQRNNEIRTFEGKTYPDMTILDALILSAKVGNFPLSYYVDKNKNTTLLKIEGIIVNNNLDLTLNSRQIVISDLDKIKIKDGDKIKLIINNGQ